MKIRLGEQRRLEHLAKLRRRVEWLLASHDLHEIMVEAPSSRAWKEVIRPMLQAEIQGFQDAVWAMDPKEFHAEQRVALQFRQFRDYIDTLAEGEDTFLKEAKELQAEIEQAEKEGLIPKDLEARD